MSGELGTGEALEHGRYYVEHVELRADDPRQVQDHLDEKDGMEWHLVGVASGSPEGRIMLFWDTQRPSFGRRSS